MRALFAMNVVSVLLLSVCTGSDIRNPGTNGGGEDGGPQDGRVSDGGPEDGGLTDGGALDGGTPTPFITQSWTVLPGVSDFYRCTQITLDSDVTITGFRNVTSEGNFRTFVMAGPTPMNPTDGDFDCELLPALIVPDIRLLYAFGPGTGAIDFPPEAAIHLEAGESIMMMVALRNEGATPSSGQTSVSIRTDGASSATHEAELIFGGTTNLNIPSDGQRHQFTGGCAAQRAYQVFGAWPTMNKLGVHQTLHVNGQVKLDTDFMATQQPIDALSIAVSEGDQILVTCAYVNSTGATVYLGGAYSAELCFLGLYRYSLDSSVGNLFECVSH